MEATLACQHLVMKQIMGHFAHVKNMLWHSEQSLAQYPQCQEEGKDKIHILFCPDRNAQSQWEASLLKIQPWLRPMSQHSSVGLSSPASTIMGIQ